MRLVKVIIEFERTQEGRSTTMLLYVLICLSLSLAGVAGLQLTYMFYLDRLDKARKAHIRELESLCRRLQDEAEMLQSKLRRLEEEKPVSAVPDDVLFAEVIED